MNKNIFLGRNTKDVIAFVFMLIGVVMVLISIGTYIFFTFFSLIFYLVSGLVAMVGVFLSLKKPKFGSIIVIVVSISTLLLAIIFNIAVRTSPLYSFSEILSFNIIPLGPVFMLLGGILRLVKKKIVIVIILLFIFFTILILIFIPLQRKINAGIENKSVANRDFLKCNFMFPFPDLQVANWQKYHCYLKTAREIGNIGICEKIPTNYIYYEGYVDEYKATYYTDSSLRDGCYFEIVTKTLDLGLCQKISKPDSCYLFVARATKDISICNTIEDDWLKNRCLEVGSE